MSLLKKAHAVEPLDSIADEFVASYVSGRDACAHVRAAYDCWHACTPPQRALGFFAYRAALDQEEQAARVHAEQAAKLVR
jgi:hypothetical protein